MDINAILQKILELIQSGNFDLEAFAGGDPAVISEELGKNGLKVSSDEVKGVLAKGKELGLTPDMLKNIDLSGIDLSSIDLSGIDLSGIDLGSIGGLLGGAGK